MYRFISPRPDSTVTDIAIGARNLDEAFQQYAADWWREEITGATAVYQNQALVARVIVFTNRQTEQPEPHLQLWK